MPSLLNKARVAVVLVFVLLITVLQLSFTAQPALAASRTGSPVHVYGKVVNSPQDSCATVANIGWSSRQFWSQSNVNCFFVEDRIIQTHDVQYCDTWFIGWCLSYHQGQFLGTCSDSLVAIVWCPHTGVFRSQNVPQGIYTRVHVTFVVVFSGGGIGTTTADSPWVKF